MIILLGISSLAAAEPTGDSITSSIEDDVDGMSLLDDMKTIFELSDDVLDSGYVADMKLYDAFRIYVFDRGYFLILSKITPESIEFASIGGRSFDLNVDEMKILDINGDGKYDAEMTLKSIDEGTAKINVKTYVFEEDLAGDYVELFDVIINLLDKTIDRTWDLGVHAEFTNFGQGPSKIRIVYSIFNDTGDEVYRGIDDKIVYTEENVIKRFGFLDLPPGHYKVTTEIFYGRNQTAKSSDEFEMSANLSSGSKKSKIRKGVIFILAIFVGALLIYT
ncbi:hypothetical protein GOV14_03160, partial [Candidatus Pacearchaeota archaeon]|nr:hypothetical protein [Candidatus Pacearchaeota archaeon]